MAADPEAGKAVIAGAALVVATWITAQWAKRTQERRAEQEARGNLSVAQLQAETADVAGLRQFVVSILGETEELRHEIDESRRRETDCERKLARIEAQFERAQMKIERLEAEIKRKADA